MRGYETLIQQAELMAMSTESVEMPVDRRESLAGLSPTNTTQLPLVGAGLPAIFGGKLIWFSATNRLQASSYKYKKPGAL